VPRYRFGDFILSPRQRALVCRGAEQPLIPRYFDLLVFLVEHRGEAVHRRQIFDQVWSDVVVSDSALSQAIRTIRRVLGDDSREPRFVRTVSRHGYRFVFPDVVEEDDDGEWTRIEGGGRTAAREDDEAHDASGREVVPADADAAGHATLRRVIRRVSAQSAAASFGSGSAGALAGMAGACLLVLGPGSTAPWAIVPVLAAIGAGCGGLAGAGVGAGLSIVESLPSSHRAIRFVAGGALGGGVVGILVELLARATLSVLVGVHVAVGGGIEGLVIGAAAGGGVALAPGGGRPPAAGRHRLMSALRVAAACGAAALVLALAGRTLVGGTIHAIAQGSKSGQAALTPLARLLGEPDFGPLTAALISLGEGAAFGLGLMLGLTRRPRISETSHETLTAR
jgi:DNA-binding winged helix-turn-helix (wHTH) protein